MGQSTQEIAVTKAEKVKALDIVLDSLGIDINAETLLQLQEEKENEDLSELRSISAFPVRKQIFIINYMNTFGNVSQACRMSAISRRTYYYWMERDPEFESYIKDIPVDDLHFEFLESCANQAARMGNSRVIMSMLMTKFKHKGYNRSNDYLLPPPQENNVVIYLPDNGRD